MTLSLSRNHSRQHFGTLNPTIRSLWIFVFGKCYLILTVQALALSSHFKDLNLIYSRETTWSNSKSLNCLFNWHDMLLYHLLFFLVIKPFFLGKICLVRYFSQTDHLKTVLAFVFILSTSHIFFFSRLKLPQ